MKSLRIFVAAVMLSNSASGLNLTSRTPVRTER